MTLPKAVGRFVPALAGTAAGLAAILFVLGLLGDRWWVFDLFSHFRWQYGATLFLSGLVLAGMRRFGYGVPLCLAGLLLVAPLLPIAAHSAGSSDRLKVLSFNVLKTNPRRGEIRRFLEEERADLVVLTEVNAAWNPELERLRALYPHQVSAAITPPDVVLLSRHPILAADVQRYRKRRWIEATVLVEGTPYHVVAAHTSPPTGRSNSEARNRQLAAMAKRTGGKRNVILCGDLNLSPYSPWFGRLLQESGLTDTSRGAGFSPTWMARWWPVAVPIDHILLSPDLRLISRRVGPSLGSDHSPVVVEFSPPRGQTITRR